MPQSRRDFLSAFLGGVTLTLTPAALNVAQSAQQSPVEPATAGVLPERESAVPVEGHPEPVPIRTNHVRIETDFTPNGTKFLFEDEKTRMLVQELYLEYNPSVPDGAWAGMAVVNFPGCGVLRLDPLRTPGAFRAVYDNQNRSLCLSAVQSIVDYQTDIERLFLCGFVGLKFTRNLQEILHAHRCKRCGVTETYFEEPVSRKWVRQT
jgi:hypothetical protein